MSRPLPAPRSGPDHARPRRSRLAWWAPMVLLAAALASGPQGCSSRDASQGPATAAQAAPSEDDLGGTLLCDPGAPATNGQPARDPEYYIVYSMNRKLRYYPDFAAAIGMKTVTTCDDARAFTVAYSDYFRQHPFFDAHLPMAPGALLAPVTSRSERASADRASQDATVEKIFNGSVAGPSGSDPFPVVQITHNFLPGEVFSNGQAIPTTSVTCSGTFISKNFILTAAHCLGLVALTFPKFGSGTPPNPSAQRQWITSSKWQIAWPDSGGVPGGMMQISADKVWAIVHQSYTGVTLPRTFPDASAAANDNGLSSYDIGLLWINPWDNDAQLPADAAKSSWAVQLESADGQINKWSLRMYGYGPTMDNEMGPLTLTASRQSQIPTGAQKTDTEPGFPSSTIITVAIFDPATDPGLCGGDSGGPLVREVLDPNTLAVVDHVIVGVNSHRSGDSTTRCPGPDPTTSLFFSQFARTDIAFADFLKPTILSWQPEGIQFKTEGAISGSYVIYHGASCQSDCTCAANEVCLNPVNDANSAASKSGSCSNNVCSDCSCVQGQCVPQTSPDGGSVASRDCDDGS
jgi:Trypsin